jgi:hypothetical protein
MKRKSQFGHSIRNGRAQFHTSKMGSDHKTEWKNNGYKNWYDEVPFHVDRPGFRAELQNEIQNLIPDSAQTENVMDHGAVDGEIAVIAVESAISALPDGGTLLIPENVTLYLNNYSINKSIRIDCRGTIKRPSYGESGTNSSYIVRLNAPCIWDGGVIDGNRQGWVDESPGERSYPIRADQPCIIKNVTSINNLKKADGNQFSGFEIRGAPAYLESCVAEDSARTFRFFPNSTAYSEHHDGSINVYKGVYYYNCEARRYSEKGFDLAGTSGFVVIDKCSGCTNMDGERRPQEFILLDTGDGFQLHTGFVIDTDFTGFNDSNVMKITNVKYTLFYNSNLTSYGYINDGSGDLVSPSAALRLQDNHTTNLFPVRTAVVMESSFNSIDYDDGVWDYNPQLAGRIFPVIIPQRSGRNWDFYAENSEFNYKESVWYRTGTDRKNIYIKCTFNAEVTNNDNTYIYALRPGFEAVPSDGYSFIFEDCKFNGLASADIIKFRLNGSMPVGTLKIINPNGSFNSRIVESTSLRQETQRNNKKPRVFQLQGDSISSGTYWKAGDLILEDLDNMNMGYKCISAGNAGEGAEFIPISEASEGHGWKNRGYQSWLHDVPFHIDSSAFRDEFHNKIQNLIPDSSSVENVMDHGILTGTASKDALDRAIALLPEGGTLLIPEHVTLLLNNYSIHKKIRVKCRGIIKYAPSRMGGTGTSSMISLDAPCIWEGGIFEGNRGGWNQNMHERIYSLVVNSPSIVKNVVSQSDTHKPERNYYNGFKVRTTAYLESCISEGSEKCYYMDPAQPMYTEYDNGSINVYEGVYFYKCRANNFTKKGFESTGNIGFIMIDECSGNIKTGDDVLPEEFISFDTGHNSKVHTGYVKDTDFAGCTKSGVVSSANVKYTILNNSNLTSRGKRRKKQDIFSSPSPACLLQAKYFGNNFMKCNLVALGGSMNTMNDNSSVWPYKTSKSVKMPAAFHTVNPEELRFLMYFDGTNFRMQKS